MRDQHFCHPVSNGGHGSAVRTGEETALYGAWMSNFQHSANAATIVCGAECASFEPGHDLHPIRARAASTMSTGWVDSVVEKVTSSGTITLVDVFGAEQYKVWNHNEAAQTLQPGDYVAWHQHYSVLALGTVRWSALRLRT